MAYLLVPLVASGLTLFSGFGLGTLLLPAFAVFFHIATGVVIACLIDVSRLSVYAAHSQAGGLRDNATLLAVATLAAFTGAFVGNRLLRKVTLRAVQTVVSVTLVVIGVALAVGVV